jgi:4-hydroxymandelate oxidase
VKGLGERAPDIRLLAFPQLELLARQSLPASVFDFVAGGAGDELSVARNCSAFDQFCLRPRVLRDVSQVSIRTTILGADLSAPIFVCPMGQQALVHAEAEVASATGAARAGVGFILSMGASASLEEVASASSAPRWFQMYYLRDRAIMADLVARAVAAGYSAICLTVDVPVVGFRRRDLVHMANGEFGNNQVFGNFNKYRTNGATRLPLDFIAQGHDLSVTWSDLDWLRAQSDLPIVLKGVMTAEDTRAAVEAGVSAVIVSNHGGRQLDHEQATLEVLSEVASTARDRIAVILDGGVRRPTDIVIALALGADAVSIGRPVLWALAIGGSQGVGDFLNGLVEELRRVLTLLGVANLEQLSQDYVYPRITSQNRHHGAAKRL